MARRLRSYDRALQSSFSKPRFSESNRDRLARLARAARSRDAPPPLSPRAPEPRGSTTVADHERCTEQAVSIFQGRNARRWDSRLFWKRYWACICALPGNEDLCVGGTPSSHYKWNIQRAKGRQLAGGWSGGAETTGENIAKLAAPLGAMALIYWGFKKWG